MKIIEGDLFDPDNEFGAIAHGVNLKGAMGAGIAAQFAQKFPQMKSEYVYQCESQRLKLGSTFFYWYQDEGQPGQMIYNIATQVETGPDARLDALAVGLHSALWHAGSMNLHSFGVPVIGAGIGGLDEDDVLSTMEIVEELVPTVQLTVVKWDGKL